MYPTISANQIESLDKYGNHNAVAVAQILSELTREVVSPKVTAGATGVTVTENFFVVPAKGLIEKATFIMDTVQTGSGNTPTVSLFNLTKNETIAVTGEIALSGTIGDKHTLVLDAAKVDVNEGDVLQVKVINPSATITVALAGKVQVAWHSVN